MSPRLRVEAALCAAVVAAPYWALLFAPGNAGLGVRIASVAAACVVDAGLVAGIVFATKPRPVLAGARFAAALASGLGFYFLVSFRNAFALLILFSALAPEAFLGMPQAVGTAAFMAAGLAFTAYEFLVVARAAEALRGSQ